MKKKKKEQELPTINREELMVGDWVMVKQYPSISLPKQMTNELFVRSLCEFRPIPLTKEFIIANGFTSNKEPNLQSFCLPNLDVPEFYVLEYPNTAIVVDIREKFFSVSVFGDGIHIEHNTLKYVHELQHIFNLFGLKKEFVLPPTNKNM